MTRKCVDSKKGFLKIVYVQILSLSRNEKSINLWNFYMLISNKNQFHKEIDFLDHSHCYSDTNILKEEAIHY